jgi:adenine-specific DNA-methyltransferase
LDLTESPSRSEQLTLPIEDLQASTLLPEVFRPIHYLGSKLRLLDPIKETIRSLDRNNGTLCDLFAGSGTVSLALSQERNTVSVDIQEYSRVLCSALLLPPVITDEIVTQLQKHASSGGHRQRLLWIIEPLIAHEEWCIHQAESGKPDAICDLLEHGCLLLQERGIAQARNPLLRLALEATQSRLTSEGLADSLGTMLLRHFGGIYFSYRQAVDLEATLAAIYEASIELRDALLAALLSTASDVVNTVGKQFAQPIRPRTKTGEPKRHLVQKIRADRSLDVICTYFGWLEKYRNLRISGHDHRVIRGDYVDALRELRGSLSIIYADPPYTRDHYSRFYHVLETICLRDNPAVSLSNLGDGKQVSRGIYRMERHQSPFCIKKQAPKAFELLFAEARMHDVPLLVSYSPYASQSKARPRLLTIDAIEQLARRWFRRVETESAGKIAHNKLNTTELNAEMTYGAEIFIVCKP